MESLSFSLLMIFLGLSVSFIVFLLMNKLVRPFLKKALKSKVPILTNIVDEAVKVITLLCSIFIFLLSVSYAVSKADIEKTLVESAINLIPKSFTIILIIVVTFVIIQAIRSIFRRLRYKYTEIFSVFLQSMVAFAGILTILEYIGIKATPFLEIFKVILYTIGLTIALSLGISIALAIQENIKQFILGKGKKRKR